MKKLMLLIFIILTLGCSTDTDNKCNVTINCQEGGIYYKEVVTSVTIDNMIIGTTGQTDIELDKGNYRLVWSYANINGFGMYLNEKTKTQEIKINGDTYILISGGEMTYD